MVVQDVQISVLDVVHALQHALLLALKDVEDAVVAPVAPDLVLDVVRHVNLNAVGVPEDVDHLVLADALKDAMEDAKVQVHAILELLLYVVLMLHVQVSALVVLESLMDRLLLHVQIVI